MQTFFFYNIAHAIYIRNQLRDREIKKKFLTMNACFLSHVEKMSTMGWCFPLKQGWEAWKKSRWWVQLCDQIPTPFLHPLHCMGEKEWGLVAWSQLFFIDSFDAAWEYLVQTSVFLSYFQGMHKELQQTVQEPHCWARRKFSQDQKCSISITFIPSQKAYAECLPTN